MSVYIKVLLFFLPESLPGETPTCPKSFTCCSTSFPPCRPMQPHTYSTCASEIMESKPRYRLPRIPRDGTLSSARIPSLWDLAHLPHSICFYSGWSVPAELDAGFAVSVVSWKSGSPNNFCPQEVWDRSELPRASLFKYAHACAHVKHVKQVLLMPDLLYPVSVILYIRNFRCFPQVEGLWCPG